MQDKSGSPVEWFVPLAYIICASWLTWHMPAFILDWLPPTDPSQFDKLSAHFRRVDVTPGLPAIFGEFTDIVDWITLLALPVLFVAGVLSVCRAPMEFEDWTRFDRIAVFIGRVTMMLILLLTSVMLYEVVVRYVFESPTLWANELSLWIAGFLFLTAGLYAMQQRSHIRIYLLYDLMPRWLQHTCDVISTGLIVTFAFFLIYGGYGEAFDKLYRWETFGTAFDPPIPATIKPTVLLVITLVAIQAVINLISDWNLEPVIHTAADDIDADELEALKRAVGSDGVGDLDVTRGTVQSDTSRHS